MTNEEYKNSNIMLDVIEHNSQYDKDKVLQFTCVLYITKLINEPMATLEDKQKLQSKIDKIYI